MYTSLWKSAVTFDTLDGPAWNFQGLFNSLHVIFGRVIWTPCRIWPFSWRHMVMELGSRHTFLEKRGDEANNFLLPLQNQVPYQSFRHKNTYESASVLEKRPLKVSKHLEKFSLGSKIFWSLWASGVVLCVWCGVVWCGGAHEGMHFSQSKNACKLNSVLTKLMSHRGNFK